MRAAAYLPGLRPGSVSWRIYHDLVAQLRALGIDCQLWTDPIPQPVDADHTVFLDAGGPAWLDRLGAPLTRSDRLLVTASRLGRQLRRDPVDLLYSEITYPYGTAAEIARRQHPGCRLVTKPTGEDVLSLPSASYGFDRFPLPRRLTDWTLRKADAVRCISPLVTDAISSRTDAPTRVIPSAVAAATAALVDRPAAVVSADRTASREALATRLGIGSARVVMALGRLHPFKGLNVLIEAMAGIDEAALVLAGPSLTVRPHGDHAAHLRQLAASAGISHRVHFTGAISHDDVHGFLSAADVVVVPSLLESMNKVSVEAVASGTPFVTTSSTGVSRFVREDGFAEIVPAGDPGELARAIADVLDDRWQIDAAAAQRFVRQFAPDVVAPQLVELFHEAMR